MGVFVCSFCVLFLCVVKMLRSLCVFVLLCVAVVVCDETVTAVERNDPFQSDWICRDNLYDQAQLEDDCAFRMGDVDCDPWKQKIQCNCGCGTYDPDCDLPTRFRPKDTKDYANWEITCGPTLMVADGRYTFCQRELAKCITGTSLSPDNS